jgi:NAD(P) transhydrogenase subunit alpha
VALTPSTVASLVGEGHAVDIEVGAGIRSGFTDRDYREAGATLGQRASVIGTSGTIVQVDGPEPHELDGPEWSGLGPDHVLLGLHDPLWRPPRATALAATGATALSLELIPRITRAQSMDVLSSTATVAGYEAVLLAASRLPRLVPLMMTAAGTVTPARFVVLGAGVAGLQAIATARRLGAVVAAYDVRPSAMEQIRSVGAKAIELELDVDGVEDEGGYAARQTEDQARRQLEQLAPHLAGADAIIATAAVPGAASPELITTAAVESMRAGSVIVDLAAERGGNCRLTRADEKVEHGGVLILGPTDLASRAPITASQMFATNILALLRHLAPEGRIVLDFDDEITAGTVLTHGGEVRHPAVRVRLGLEPVPTPAPSPAGGGADSQVRR